MEQLTLFTIKPVYTRRRTVPSAGVPRWAKYSQRTALRPHQCDFCLLNCHEDAMAPIPRRARFVRRVGDKALYLCLQHANEQRVIDKLTVYPAKY